MRVVARVAVAAALGGVVVLLFGLVTAGNGHAPLPGSDGRVELSQPYDAAFIAQWVRGCVGSGESDGFCRCAIDEYTRRLRPDEFETAAAVAQGGGHISELPRNLREVVAAVERDCR